MILKIRRFLSRKNAVHIPAGLNPPPSFARGVREELTISDNVATFNPIEERAYSSLTCDLSGSLAGGLETETDPPAVAEDSLATADSVARVRRWRDEFYVRDHLGNVRVVVDLAAESPGEFILERNDYLPFGTRAESDGLPAMESNRYRYAGKEEQRLSSINGNVDPGLVDFGARMYDPSICRWTSVDPLAHRYPGMTPYGYCGGDPVNRVDPDGRTDYFSEKGYFLYNDGRDNGSIRIIMADEFSPIIAMDYAMYDGDERFREGELNSLLFKASFLFSSAIINGTISKKDVLKVYDYYNWTGEKLVYNSAIDGNIQFYAESPAVHYFRIHFDKYNSIELFNNSYNIINSINGHEGGHLVLYKALGHNAYAKLPTKERELRAIAAQRNHSSWSQTTNQYKKQVKKYEEKVH